MNFGQGNQEKSQETQDFCRPNHTSFLSFQSNQLYKKSQAQTRVESQTYNTYHQEHL